ncbi:ABC transporter substrate-binding protein [Sulfitobacter profundi]|uniref:ABC transporter substrate-binding protein n=1 Tax=Sulfitobacter profundi TaxID=2679961 RepID=A0ABW1Z2F3_9RHOB
MKNRIASMALAGLVALPAAAQEPVAITVNAVQIIGTIDPAKINDYTEYMAAVNLYDAMTTVDATGTVIPQLAKSWDISDDSLTYTFHLKEDAKFQNGDPVTAADVVYSVQRLLSINEGPAYLFQTCCTRAR